jgi:Tfp pilus assembly protein PilF
MKNSIFLSFIFLLFVLQCISQTNPKGGEGKNSGETTLNLPRRYAIVIGVSDYKEYFDKLRFAHTDATNFISFLKKDYVKNLDTNSIKYLINDKAVLDSVNYVFSHLTELFKFKKGDELYIYFSGHGVLTAIDYNLIFEDNRMEDPALALFQTYFGIRNIRQNIRAVTDIIGAKVYVIIDACRNTASVDSETADRTELLNQLRSANKGEADIFASSIGGFSYETELLQPGNGVFTYFLLLGLQGAADTSGDNKVTLQEIQDYLNQNIKDYVQYVLRQSSLQEPTYGGIMEIPNERKNVVTILPPEIRNRFKQKGDSIRAIINRAILGHASQDVDESLQYKVGSIGTKGFTNKIFRAGYLLKEKSVGSYITGDTLNNVLYNSFMSAVSRSELVSPKGRSAYDYYLQIKNEVSNRSLQTITKEKLYYALFRTIRTFTDNYLSGKLSNLKKNDFDIAYEETEKLIELLDKYDPLVQKLQPTLLFFSARALATSNNPIDWDKGIKIIDSAISKTSNAAYLYHTKGVLYENKSRFFTAIKYYRIAAQLAPSWLYPQYNLATSYFEIQEYDKSMQYLQRILTRDSTFSRIYSWIGYNYETVADLKEKKDSLKRVYYDSAVYYNQKALTLDSTNSYAYLNLGRTFFKKTDSPQNLEKSKYYLRIGGLKYNDPQCLTQVAKLTNTSSNTHDSADLYYKLALHVNPLDTSAIDNYAFYLHQKGLTKQADSLYSVALNATKNKDDGTYDYKYYSKYRSFVFKTISSSKADSIFRVIIKDNKEDPYVFIQHSQQYEEIDSLLKAEAILRLGISKIDSSPSLNYAMARLYFKNYSNSQLVGTALDTSLHYLRILEQISPEYSLLNYGLGEVKRLQHKDSVTEYLNIARSINRFVNNTANFSYDLVASADSAIARRNYADAITYYSSVKEAGSEDKFNLTINISKSYYLLGQLEVAARYCNEAERYITDDVDEDRENIPDTFQFKRQLEMKGLIEFDKKSRGGFKKALDAFATIDTRYSLFPDYLAQAACYYMLNKQKLAKRLATRQKERSIEAYRKILDMEGRYYSSYFVHKVKQLIDEIGPSFFEKDKAKDQEDL